MPMSRSEEPIDNVPRMKMTHLMVNRRQVPDKKTSLVNETLNDGLVTFALDRQESVDVYKPQQILKHPPRRSYKYSEPASLSSPRRIDEAVRRADFEKALKETANATKGEEANGDDGILRKSSRRQRRAASLDTKQLDAIRLGPTLTTSLSLKENRNSKAISEKLIADDFTGKFAYISLDGRLINAELATSVTSIGGMLGDEEAQAWEDFAPMQRVLIVAVSAAAAGAAKHRNRKEIDLLLKTVKNREKELILLRRELSELCKQTINTNANHSEPLLSLENMAIRSSPKTPAQPELTIAMRHSFDGDNTKVKLDLNEAWSCTKPAVKCPVESESLRGSEEYDERRLPRDSPVNKDVVFVESSPCESVSSFSSVPVGDEAWAKEEAKWYVNPMVEISQDFYDISTPERCNAMFSICNPAMEGSFEWTVLRSSFASRELDLSAGHLPVVESPMTAPTQKTVSNNSSVYQTRSEIVDDWAVHKDHKAMRALCAAVVLDLRKQMLTLLDKEASKVLAALDTSVDNAKTQIASMHLAVASCWNESVSKALTALSPSPSEFDSYFNEAQGSNTWSDISKIEESIVAWRQCLETTYGARVPSQADEGKSPNNWSLSERTVSGCGANERLASSAYPGYVVENDDRDFGFRSGGPVSTRNSTEDLAEQLLGELDEAVAKVAVMENQMEKLEQDVARCDGKQSCRLALENKVKDREDVAELVRQIQSKEVEVADLKRGQQNLKRKSKTRKIKKENILCSMATPNGYGAIYWERTAIHKKTKFETEPGESVTWRTKIDIVKTISEPKALLDTKNQEIEELKVDFKRRDAELDILLAAAESTNAESEVRLALLEELCRQKDSTLSYLKQDMQALESKVQKSRVHQSPSVPRSRRNTTSSAPSSSSGYGTSQKQRFSEKYAPPLRRDPILEHLGRFRREVPVSNKGHFRNLHINTPRHDELTDDGRSEHAYDQETSHDFSSPPGSTIGDDCSVNSLAFSETEVESRLGSEYCSSGDDSRYRSSKDRLYGTKGSSYNPKLQKQKSVSSDLRKAVTSTASSARGLTRSQNNRTFTSSSSVSNTASGDKYSSKALTRNLSGEIKKVVKPRTNCPTVPNSPKTRLGAVAANHRRSSSLDMNFKTNFSAILDTSGLSEGSVDSSVRSSIKRKRWA